MDVQFVTESIKILLYILYFTNISCVTTDQKVLGPEKPNKFFKNEM